ncbi:MULTISPECIES: papain-like cysteine protease family protein [Leuconostoc]|uniref:Peptidase C39-like domain-containing protein n=2 Tax=Leuconostoc kimchii TaxID=136609 RepID=D5T584_LEUKI|nr:MULTISPECIES: papain-like cysteine protease family protein [Leuconostoc]ADG41569.1 hypothetical protein LKI_10150 [Leuconostoc kimchii IMSNU 11154]AEJ30516.1 hypothetical protein LGMK_02280 [Leuconostoc sp. C2]QBR47570.1 glucosyl transferase [Leuconostoc kimchii]
MIKKHKLYKSGKLLVTGIVLTAGIMVATGATTVHADTITNAKNTAIIDKGTTNSDVLVTDSSAPKGTTTQESLIADNDSNVSESKATDQVSTMPDQTLSVPTNQANTTPDNVSSSAPANQVTTSIDQNSGVSVNQATTATDNKSSNVSVDQTNTTSDRSVNTPTNQVAPAAAKDSNVITKKGWVNENGVKRYYVNNQLVVGQKKIDNYWYNFDKQGNYSVGLTNLSTKTVLYDNQGHMNYGYHWFNRGLMYFDTIDGHAVTGKRYYGNNKLEYYGSDFKQVRNNYVRTNAKTIYFFGANGDAVTGQRYYDNHKMEFYGNDHNQIRNNYVRTNASTIYFFGANGDAVKGERYYANSKMEFYGNDYNQVRNNYVRTGNTFYFMGQYGDAIKGFRTYGKRSNQVEYYGTNFKQLRNMSITVNSRKYSFGSNGDLIVANKPTYFSQLDSRWSSHKFNDYTMGQAGCVPTSIAMVLNGSYGMAVNPDNVRNVMNKISISSFGATGRDLVNTVKYYGRQVEQLSTATRTTQLLQQGVPVIFYVNVGGGMTHAITTFGYSNGATQVYDPFNREYYNGWYNINYISSKLSQDSADWNAGRPVFGIM